MPDRTTKLSLSRRRGQRVYVGETCITIDRCTPSVVELTVRAPEGVKVLRGELMDAVRAIAPVGERR